MAKEFKFKGQVSCSLSYASTGLTFEFPTFQPQVHWHINIAAPPTWVTETGFTGALNGET